MTDEESLEAAIHEKVSLVPHDAGWAGVFEAERRRLGELLPDAFVAIEHVGSTAVPGLAAKPIVDIMAGVEAMAAAQAIVEILCTNGYSTSRTFDDSMTDRRWLMRSRDGHRTHHLHIVAHGAEQWRGHLAFRDALRRDHDLARRYAELKALLATQHADDRDAYTTAKSGFVEDIVAAELRR